jgi:small nuclear ribonucleoprotein (snRNP)-like protein
LVFALGVLLLLSRYMNLVLDDASEVDTRTGAARAVGQIMLKGDTITLIQVAGGKGVGME